MAFILFSFYKISYNDIKKECDNMEFVTLSKKEFLDYSKKNNITSFFQTTYWGEIKKDNGWDSHFLGLKDGKQIIAATLLLSKKIKIFGNMFYAPRGFLLDYNNLEILENFTNEIKKYLKEHNALFLKINPYVDYQERNVDGEEVEGTKNETLMNKLKDLGFKHNGFYIDQDKKKDLEPRWISVLDIKDMTMDDLYKNMRSSCKWRINNSRKNCLKIIEADEDNLVEFKNLMKHTAERREFIDRPLSYYQNMFKILKKENLVKVLLVEINFKELKDFSKEELEKKDERLKELEGNTKKSGQIKELELEKTRLIEKINLLEKTIEEHGEKKIIAGGWYMLFGREIIYLFGASYKAFMKYNSQYLLQYEMINYAVDNGYEAFNFYGIDGNFSEESKGYGLFDFKRGFNACVHELIGEFDLVINPIMYKLYTFSFNSYKLIKNLIKR